MAAAFSHELGVFDPTFPGVTLHFPNEATWTKAREVSALQYSLAASDMRAKNPLLSAADVNPERVLQHLFESVDNGIPLSLQQKEALGLEFIKRDPESAVGNLALASAFEHERRHFHDWLLSPYTAAINAIRTEVFINYGRLRPTLQAGGVTVIPVPLTRWMRKSESEQRELVEMWQSLLADRVEVRLPDLTSSDVAETIAAIERRYGSIGALFEAVGAEGLDAAAVFEASALLIQTQAIHDLFGETAQSLFLSTMAEQGRASRYGWFLNVMNSSRRPGEIMENDTLSAIATWCLLGNNTADSGHAHPLIRLGHAVKCVRERGFTGMDGPTQEILKTLDRSSGAMPYDQLLSHSVKLGDSVVQMHKEAASQSGAKFILGVAESYAFLHACHTYMVNLFLNDPDGYCQPVAYLDRTLGKLPEPPLRQTFGRPFYCVKRLDLEKFARVTLFEAESTADQAFLRQHIIQVPKGVVNLQIADNWQYLCGLVDTMFAEHNRDSPEIEAQRAVERKQGLYLMEVLC